MPHNTLVIKLKTTLKGWLCASPFKRVFIFLYKLNKCRPWSTGYSFYKFSYIKNVIEKELHHFRKGALPQRYGTGLDERVVEYPWVFSRLRNKDKVILDAGSSLNHWDILSLSCLQEKTIYLTTLFYEGQYGKKNIIYQYEDLRKLSFPDESFDAVVCISTIEHIGMDNTYLYGTDKRKKENVPDAYLQAVQELKRVLKKGGVLYLTMPYGMYKQHQWFQVFDGRMLRNIIDEFNSVVNNITYFKYSNDGWQFAREQQCQEAEFFDIHKDRIVPGNTQAASGSIACLELVR